MAKRSAMHSRLLDEALSEFAGDAARLLDAELAGGAEIPFELASSKGRRGAGGGADLYMYRPLTARFIAERWMALRGLQSAAAALRALEACHGLDRYVASRSSGTDGRSLAKKATPADALKAFLDDLFHEQTDFTLHRERIVEALKRLDASTAAAGSSLTLIAILRGIAISSTEIAIAKGLTIARPDSLSEMPEEALRQDQLVVTFSAEERDASPAAAVAEAVAVLRDLLRGLRLFGDGRVGYGPVAWVRIDGGVMQPLPLGLSSRPRQVLLVTSVQEDELRAFCSLVARRAPAEGPIAWALTRFEFGCERSSPYEALSDHLLSLQALLEADRSSPGLLASRVAALCAPPERRRQTAERVLDAVALERSVVTGEAEEHTRGFELAADVAGWLKALLSDVICGHLDRDLAKLADELLVTDGGGAEAEADGFATEADGLEAEAQGSRDGGSADTTQVVRATRSTAPEGDDSEGSEADDPLDALAQGILPL